MIERPVQTLSTPLLGFGVALAIGLLIGSDRERSKGEGPGRAAAGLSALARSSRV